MKILDRYILKKLLTTFLFVVFIIVAIIVVIDVTEKIDDFSKPEVPLGRIFGYYVDFIPWIANLISPITVFIATVFVTANMAGRTEIVAILASGVSFKRMLVPYFGAALIIAMGSFYFSGWVIPDANKSRRSFEIEFIKGKYYFSKTDFHVQASPTKFLYLERYDNNRNVGHKFTMELIENGSLKEKFSAYQIEWNDSTQKWKLKRWQRRVILAKGEEVTFGESMDSTLLILPKDFQSQYRLWEALTLPELTEYINEISRRGLEGAKIYEVEKYFRFTMPFTVFVLVFIGVIVSSRKSRGGTGLQIALGFIISFIFIIFVITSRGIAEGGLIPPIIAVWIPNVVFSFIGLFMYKYMPR